MTRGALLCILIAVSGCRERGTFEVDVGTRLETCESEFASVRAELIADRSCDLCQCGMPAACPACEGSGCIRACEGTACPIDEAREGGIEFEPPAPGPYAVMYRFLDTQGQVIAVVCTEVVVEEDGTQSATVEADYAMCCGSPVY